MKQFLKLFILQPLRKIRWAYYYMLHSIIFRIMNVNYQEMPEIFGRFIINNNGSCRFGKGLTFRSDLTSNLVGLYKPCTVVVSKVGCLEIEDYTGFSGVSIYCTNNIKIGKYCKFGGNVSI